MEEGLQVLKLLKIHKAILVRQGKGEGYWDDKGNWLERTDRMQTEITCCIQPTPSKGQAKITLPNSVTNRDCRDIYTYTQIFTTDEYSQTVADEIVFNGVTYVVMSVFEWFHPTKLVAHYHGLLVRKDKLQNDTVSSYDNFS